MKVGSLVKRKPQWGDWVKHNPWMTDPKDFEIGIIVSIEFDGYWDFEVLWQGEYTGTHDESELEEIKCTN